jgi:diadenosine tetraphosphate (Ap4A) HIT family hydrolase
MKLDKNCFYCMKDERRDKLMIEVCKLDISTLFLFKEQTYRGRCIVAFDGHEAEIFNLNKDEAALFINDVSRAAKAIANAFKPDKINYGAFGDKMPHLHMHLVPKYEGKEGWGSTFEMNPDKVYLNDAEYMEMIRAIKKNL